MSLSKLSKLACLPLLLISVGIAANAAAPPDRAAAPVALGIDAQNLPVQVSDYRGRVLLVSFWASWCAPCLNEMSVLENLQKNVGDDQLAVVGVNWRESRRDFRRLQQQLAGIHLRLSSDADGAIGARYGVTAIPQLFVIDRDGRIAYSHSGYDPATMVTPLLGEITSLLLPDADHADDRHAKMSHE